MSVLVRVNFSDPLILDPNAQYALYFKNANGSLFGTNSAILVEDENNIQQYGYTNASTSSDTPNFIEFMFDYDNNNQGGRTPGTDAEIFIVATGINIARYVVKDATIKNQPVNNFVLAAEEELYYG